MTQPGSIRFDGRVAVVTGAGNGLGKSYALFLASRGAKVVVNDLGGTPDGRGQSTSPASQVVEEIRSQGGEAVANYDSVSDPQGAQNIIRAALDKFGTVDILINNAGVLRDKTFLKMTLEDFEFVLKVHLFGTIYVTKAAFPVMVEKKYGRIVLATSAAGLFGNFGQTNYSAAKMGIIGFMNSLKLEGQNYNIRVNTIAPLAASRLAAGIFPEKIMPRISPELVVPAVAYLCSEQCPGSGEIISAGGGFFAKAHMVESRGIWFDRGSVITPEMVAERYGEITQMDGALHFEKALEEVGSVLGRLMEE